MLTLTKRKYSFPSALLMAAILVCVLLFGVKRQFYREMTCYVSSVGDPGYSQQVTVTFDGTYLDFLLRTDQFDGFIDVTPFSLMPEGFSYIPGLPRECMDPWELPITTNPKKLGTIGYFLFENGTTSHEIRGILWAEEDLRRFIMTYMVPVEKENGSTHWETVGYISYPDAMTAEEARAVMFSE